MFSPRLTTRGSDRSLPGLGGVGMPVMLVVPSRLLTVVLGLAGLEGGAMVGYGYKMGDLYAGLEGEIAAGDVKFKLTSASSYYIAGGRLTMERHVTIITAVEAEKEWTGGMFGRLGLYLNKDTLLLSKVEC